MNFRKQRLLVLVLTCFGLGLSGCSKDFRNSLPILQPSPPLNASPYGTFSSNTCFLNKLSSISFGQNIYSKASMQFNENGTGLIHFLLYEDSACNQLLMDGENAFTFKIMGNYGAVTVFRVDQQNDVNNSSDVTRYWLTVSITERGYYADVDYSTGYSGAYFSEPTEQELSVFASNIVGKAVFFERQ